MHLRPQEIRQDDEESREAASWGTFMLFESREKRILSHFISLSLSLSLSLSPPELALPLSLSRSLEDHVWNHLISQKTGQSDEED